MFFVLAALSGVLGFIALVKIVEAYLASTRMDFFMIVLAALGLGLARFWSKQARAIKS